MLLIVDEEYSRAMAYSDVLKSLGYDVKLTFDVDSFVSVFKDNLYEIDAVILDIMMPSGELFTLEQTEQGILTGVKLYEYIRSELKWNGPIIIYTALNRPDLLNSLDKRPMTSVVHKPNSVAKVVEKLDRFNLGPSNRSALEAKDDD